MREYIRLIAKAATGSIFVGALISMLALAGCGSTTGATSSTGGNSSVPPVATATSAPAQSTATSSSAANTTTIKITGGGGSFAFQPATVTVKVGATVMWVNDSSVPHTATSDSGSAVTWDSSAINTGGGTFSFTFTKAGTYSYHCAFHPFMHGKIVVTA